MSSVGAVGLNLTEASVIIHYVCGYCYKRRLHLIFSQDVGWSGLQEEQVDGRAARYGQSREVHCYHMFAKGTTDMIMDTNAREKHIFLAALTKKEELTSTLFTLLLFDICLIFSKPSP